MLRTGRFAGPVAGLRYTTPSCSGFTGEDGSFTFRDGEVVAFSVGSVVFGAARGAQRITVANLVARVDGDLHRVADPELTNIARLLQTLNRNDGCDDGIRLTRRTHDTVGDRTVDFRQGFPWLPGAPDDPVQAFGEDPVVMRLVRDLNRADSRSGAARRRLVTPAAARNEVRRNILGVRRFRDVRIPLYDGSFVYADVFRPEGEEPVPVVMSRSPRGRVSLRRGAGDDWDAERHEALEDGYFLGDPDGCAYRSHFGVDPASWVPRGYAVVLVDRPAAAGRRGAPDAPGSEEAGAYRDAIEWAGVQPWSNGAVGLWAGSHHAVGPHAPARPRPVHLRAMIVFGPETDPREEAGHTGGTPDPGLGEWSRHVAPTRTDPSPEPVPVPVPLWAVASASRPGGVPQPGGTEAYVDAPTPHKKLDFWNDDWRTTPHSATAADDYAAFLDHWLKGIDNGIMDRPPVRLEIRTGEGTSYVQEEDEWPIARTEYLRYHLDALPSDPVHPTPGNALRLTRSVPRAGRTLSCPAEEPPAGPQEQEPRRPSAAVAGRGPGATFVSEPLTEDVVLAGRGKARLWVSGTSDDMDVHVTVRVLDEQNREVDFGGSPTVSGVVPQPLATGWLKVPNPGPDRERPTAVEVEIPPHTGRVRRGQRIRVDVQPRAGGRAVPGTALSDDPTGGAGARTTLHTGPAHPSHVCLPVVPPPEA
ncbi:CocE/NonD family hydrolase [Streptomyces sp. NPDC090306]|uniref:CocE/NonD family hydrolase n=1 Tax=Streptomyces sp. NPDC090306 TaxID=3365961 RepID=UPI0037FEE29B